MDQKTTLQNILNNYKVISKKLISTIKQNIQLNNFILNILNNNPTLTYKDVLYFIKFNITPLKCHHCGKTLNFKKSKAKQKYCNRSCSVNSEERHQLLAAGIRKAFKEKGNLIKEHIKQTCLKRYGVTTNLAFANCHSKEKIEKTRQNNLKKYGVTTNFNIPQIRLKTNLGKYKQKWKNLYLIKDYVTPMFTQDQYVYDHDNTILKWKCTKCGNIFVEKQTHRILFNNKNKYIPRCMKCYPYTVEGVSQKEKALLAFCKQYYPNCIHSNKTIIKPCELDIVIPDIKLAIEFNGIYWHSLERGAVLNYHLDKKIACQNAGYRLIYIWEDDWDNNQSIIKQKLINIFENKEIIDYNQILDRDWYIAKQIPDYNLQILSPKIIIRGGYQCENSGYLKYTKI